MDKVLSLPLKPGRHVAFTGIDGAGKSTQAGHLAYYLQDRYGPTYLAEPRTDFVSKLLHVIAFQHGGKGRREYFGDHVVDFSKAFDVVRDYYSTIAPLLAAGMNVVEPRSIYCRIAMALAMTGGRDEKMEEVLSIIPRPDLLLWIDTDPPIALDRVIKRGIDKESLDDLQRFRDAYHKLPEASGWVHLNGNEVQEKIAKETRRHADVLFVSPVR